MATQEKLLKSLEILKNLSRPNQTADTSKKKDKIQHCHVITDAISNASVKIAPNFHTYLSITVEVLLDLCDDPESDVRMMAEESLNRIIRALMSDGNVGKIQIELHKSIKRNGAARTLRAALGRFALLAHHIRPHKGKPYVVNLLPALMKISERSEEQIHETLANSLSKIMQILGCFTSDNEIKSLLKTFLKNVSNPSASIRRTTALCILNVCLNCRKPLVFVTYVLNCLLDLVLPVCEDQSYVLILGVMANFKTLLPYLNTNNNQDCNSGSGKEIDFIPLSSDKFLQIYELCIFNLNHKDHNVINASLETLNIFLLNCPDDVRKILTSDNGVGKSRIFQRQFNARLKSPSQLSVATNLTTDDLFVESELTETIRSDIEKWIDESKLSVIDLNVTKSRENLDKTISLDEKSINSELDTSYDYNNDFTDGLKSQSIGDNLEKLTISDNSSEKSFSYMETEEKNDSCPEIAIGSFLDREIPLIYCARLICKNFLLSGSPGVLIPDKNIRVSVKSLAISCFSSVLQVYPKVILLFLDKNYTRTSKNVSNQQISDILLFHNHSDPQLRGLIRIVIANFLKQVLLESRGSYDSWISCTDSHQFKIENLICLLIKGLQDESSNCCRQSILSLNISLEILMEFCGFHIKPILQILPFLATNTYWLVKVTFCELLSKLPYITINDLGSNCFQTKVIGILFEFLDDDDIRVRSCASNSIVKIIPYLYFEEYQIKENTTTAKAICYKNLFLTNIDDREIEKNSKNVIETMPFPLNQMYEETNDKIEFSLAKIVEKLCNSFVTATSKYFISGCLESLSLLSNIYPTTVYTKAWNCYKNKPNSLDLLNISINLLKNSSVTYDLNCHCNLLTLSSNLYAGQSLCLLKPIQEIENNSKLWDMFPCEVFQNLSEQYLIHLVKLLNIFHHVFDEITIIQPQTKAVLPNLTATNAISPIKRRKSDLDKKLLSPLKITEKDDKLDKRENVKLNTLGAFVHLPHYMKIYEILRSAYTNYKISLESEACEKFLAILRQTLTSFSVLMEIGSLIEFRRIADEILSYFRSTFILEAEITVECVQQLLRCLFGTNLTANLVEICPETISRQETDEGFYCTIFQKPYSDITASINSLKNINKINCDGDSTVMGYLHRKNVKKPTTLARSSDKVLANYIRIFEPMVIKSLKQYTITSNVKLQCRVLQLLSQLIQLRVNYCLLDSEQIFISFVLKQFEFIEEGQILFTDKLIPKIFQFLVQLSYSKQHSKSIIGIPKIIQLCDGLMASGQSPITHCIPALEPIVEDIFLTRNKSNTFDVKELETTRDVVLVMLLRLCEYHQILDLITLILNDSKYCCDNTEKWLRWSIQVLNILLPMLKQNKLKLDNIKAFVSLKKLIFALNPKVFQSIDNVILLLFQDPITQNCSTTIHGRWLAKILIALLILSPTKEDILITKLKELKSEFVAETIFENTITVDPLNVVTNTEIFNGLSSEMIFIHFLFRVLLVITRKMLEFNGNCEEIQFLVEELSIFLMYCLHMFQSGSHCKIANLTIKKLNEIHLDEINENFLKMAVFFPTLMNEWCYFLTLLNYNDRNFWSKVLKSDCSYDQKEILPINAKIVKTGAIILYCDYMTENRSSEKLSWLLSTNVTSIINLSEEAPISEFISAIHRNPTTSKLFIKKISENCLEINDPVFKTKLLKCIENTHPKHTGSLLKLLLPVLLLSRELAVSRLVANFASRKIELLLTMSMEDVNSQLTKEDLLGIIKGLKLLDLVKKHESLSGLLNKLCNQYYDITPLEFDQKRNINPEYIKRLQINKLWYLSQINGKDNVLAELLTKLEFNELIDFMTSQQFNKLILKDCIKLGVNQMRREHLKDESPIIKASVECLLKEIQKICDLIPNHEVFNVCDRTPTDLEVNYFNETVKLFQNDEFCVNFLNLIPPTIAYVESLVYLPNLRIPDENSSGNLIKFNVLCLEFISFLIDFNESKLNINLIDCGLQCSNVILKEDFLCNYLCLDNNMSWLCSAVNCLYKIVNYLLINENFKLLPKYLLNTSESAGQTCYQLYTLVSWLYKMKNFKNIPNFLFKSIKSIIIVLSRLPLVNSYVLIPQKVWKTGWEPELTGKFHTQVPLLPIELLQEIDILEEFIFRITLLGWTNRQQFEETWMCLLSVLCNSPTDETDLNEINDVIHASSLAVKAITTLLLQTLQTVPGNANISQLIHVSRDLAVLDEKLNLRKLKKIQEIIENRHKDFFPLINVFKRANLEKCSNFYGYNQISIKYFLITTKMIENTNCDVARIWKEQQIILEKTGLDINSCLQFLLDFYTQLIKPQSMTQLRLLHEAVRSVVIISDLFTDKVQFQWMLDMFLELSKLHTVEDELLHQYLIVGICKATAVLTPDLETYENVKKMLVQYLKSSFLPSRIACLHGLLYIIEGCKLSNISIGGISDEMQIILPCAVEYIQCQLASNNGVLKKSQEHTLLVWALAFFLIENVDEIHMENNFVTNTLQTAFTVLQQKPTIILQKALIKGIERLLITKQSISEKVNKQIMNLALEKMKSDNPIISLLGKQLLLSYMYIDCRVHLENANKTEDYQTNPDHLVQTIEKVSAIFEHTKKGYVFEVEVLCWVLPDILSDFFSPSDILTKVISEFLSPQQPHPKFLSRIVFKVFERAIEQNQLQLLQDWVVFSLSNITQSLSLGMAIWCLTCFFISASPNEWLRAFFPYIQTRVGRYEYEDRKMLCIAGSDFYKNLTNDKQKQTFIENFNKIKEQPDCLFHDLLNSL